MIPIRVRNSSFVGYELMFGDGSGGPTPVYPETPENYDSKEEPQGSYYIRSVIIRSTFDGHEFGLVLLFRGGRPRPSRAEP
jgi:hypothetical protein